jgi:hypothetical protein
MARLSPAQRAAFAADGYLAPLDALSADEAAGYERRLAARLGPTREANAGLRNKPHLLLRWVAELVRDPRLLDPVEDLLGPALLILRSVFFVKPPGDRGYVAWHQDVAYWDLSSADRVVSAWIAVTDSTADNGCVRVVPGSHRAPLLEHRLAHDGHNRLVHGQAAAVDVPPERVACLELRAGQMSLHDGRILHGSLGNPSNQLRPGWRCASSRPTCASAACARAPRWCAASTASATTITSRCRASTTIRWRAPGMRGRCAAMPRRSSGRRCAIRRRARCR